VVEEMKEKEGEDFGDWLNVCYVQQFDAT
jgi:hypothetical protein